MKFRSRQALSLALILGAAFVCAGIFSPQPGSADAPATASPEPAAPSQSVQVAEQLARGRHIATAFSGCTACHGANLGGQPLINDPKVAILWAPNLTSGKGGFFATHSAADFKQAVLHGIAPDGTRLLVMPAWDYAPYSPSDFAAILAYVRSVPPVDNVSPAKVLGPGGKGMIASGEMSYDADHLARDKSVPDFDTTPSAGAGYGAYLARISGCESCHGVHLSGQKAGMPPLPANLTPTGIGSWTEAGFVKTIRTGVDPNGRTLSSEMPWKFYSGMTDDELHAIFAFLKTVPARNTGD